MLNCITITQSTVELRYKVPHNDSSECSLLSKGLGFVPTNWKPEKFQSLQDLSKFYRKIRFHAFFNNFDQTIDDRLQTQFSQEDEFTRLEKRDSTFTPCEGQFEAVDKFIDECRKDIAVAERSGPTRSNLNDNEEKAMKRLRQRKDIVIKQADKGGAVVVWRKDLYQKEADQRLSNERFYTHLETDRTDEINTFIKSEIDSMICARDLPDTAVALLVEKPNCSNFYILPKIEKPGNLRALPTFVKETNHALNNEYGLNALKYILEKRNIQNPQHIPF